MTKKEFLDTIKRNMGEKTTNADAAKALDAVVASLKEVKDKNEKVSIQGFGLFKGITTKEKKMEMRMGPRKGETVILEPKKKLKFKDSQK